MRLIQKLKKKVRMMMPVMILAMILSACQPTPESPAVIYGRDLEDKIARSSASLAAYDAPDRWQETLGSTDVEIDATITVPDVTAFPVYLVEKALFYRELTEPLTDYFIGDRAVVKDTGSTREELEERLIYFKKMGDDPLAVSMVEDLEAELQDTPETAEPEYITDLFIQNSVENISGVVELEDGGSGRLSISANGFSYKTGEVWLDSTLGGNDLESVGDVGISPEDAVDAAFALLSDLGVYPMTVYSIEKAAMYPSAWAADVIPERLIAKGFSIRFARSIDGISARVSESTTYNYQDEFAYVAPFIPEEIEVFIDEAGEVQQFSWFNRLEITETKSPNVSLMPFEEIEQRIRDMLFFINAYDDYPTTIRNIEMNMTLINIMDEPDKAMYVPAWYIHCEQEIDTGYGLITQERLLVLNAVDGGRVLEAPQGSDMEAILEEERNNDE